MARTSPSENDRSARWLSLQDAADLYSVSVSTIRRRIASGDLPAGRCGRSIIRVKALDVDLLFRTIPNAKSMPRRRAS